MKGWHSVREALPIVGKRVLEVTCEDWDEVCKRFPDPKDRISEVYVHFDDGTTLTLFVSEVMGFKYDGHEDDGEELDGPATGNL